MCPLKTYLVEDSAIIRENLIAALEEMASIDVVGTAEDEASASTWINKLSNHFDLVIVDIFLKGGSGLGVIRSAVTLLKKKSRNCKIVVLSNYVTDEMRRKCLALGADKVFDKSDELEELMQYCAQLASTQYGNLNVKT